MHERWWLAGRDGANWAAALPPRRAVATLLVALCVAIAVLAPSPAAAGSSEDTLRRQALHAGIDAYVYGFPLLAERRVTRGLPMNAFAHVGSPATPVVRLVVLPNADTPYSTSRLDLRSEPIVLEVPKSNGRYYTMQLLDAYTNVFAYVGRRVTGTRPGRYAIVGPRWRGTLPEGVRRIDSPTPDVWLLGRILPRGLADLPAIRHLQRRFTLSPLSVYEAGGLASTPVVLPQPPAVVPPAPLPEGLAFFDALGEGLASDPPPGRDRRLLDRLARFGIGPGLRPSGADLDPAIRAGLTQAAAEGPRVIAKALRRMRKHSARRNNGWLIFPSRIGRFGRDYLLRAVVNKVALGANVPAEAMYPLAFADVRRRPLDGKYRYVVHFDRGKLPPVGAFWSLTVYGPDLFLTPNAINRYALGSNTPSVRRNRDGSLDLVLQRSAPGKRKGNWIPVPRGRFVLALRLFQPKRSVLEGRWRPPTVARVK